MSAIREKIRACRSARQQRAALGALGRVLAAGRLDTAVKAGRFWAAARWTHTPAFYPRQNKLLQGLTEEQLALLVPLMTPEEFSPGDVIVRQSQPPERVYLLLEGRAPP